jgi:HAD superfamily hydrolase (TIGR01484 family)
MKILASDFDETIYYLDNPEKNKKNIDAIKRFVSQGNIFCIITGRNYTDLKKLLIENDIPYSYLICEDGAKIFNNMDYCLETVLLNEKEIKQIIPIIEEYKWDYYLDDGYNHTNNYNDCVKIVINCSNEEEKNEIVKIIKSKVNIHIYASRTHINIIQKSVNKENALKKLFNIEKLDYNILYVVGDNYNDYEMLKRFNGAVIKKHHPMLNELGKKEYESLSDYIEELMKN